MLAIYLGVVSLLQMQNNPLRALFPQLLSSHDHVYLDSAATSHKPSSVIERLRTFYATENANVHRSSHVQAAKTTEQFESVRQQVQQFIGARSPSEIVWTKGATESINLVANGLTASHFKGKKNIVLSALEHHANLVPWQQLALRYELTLAIMPVDDNGILLLEPSLALINHDTALVAMSHVSNALGNINPISPIIRKAKEVGALTLIDGAQAVSHLPVDVQALDCDFYVFSAHKMYGPTGLGVLFGKMPVLESLQPYQFGGEMIQQVEYHSATFQAPPYKFEAGTPNIAGVMGLGAALTFINLHRQQIHDIENELYLFLINALRQVSGVRLWGDSNRSVAVQSFTVQGLNIQDLSILLSEQNIAIRTGHHCTMPLMKRLGIAGTLRVSMACYNSIEDIQRFIDALSSAIAKLCYSNSPEIDKQQSSKSEAKDVLTLNSKTASGENIKVLGQNVKAARGWDGVYRQIMLAGKELVRLPDFMKRSEHEIVGCESQVWLHCELHDQKVRLQGDSPSKIVRGLLAIVFEVLNEQTPEYILSFDLSRYLHHLGLARHLSPSRGNGLSAVVAEVKKFCRTTQ
ncbi:MAG: SufS family cysteine desulfurase [Paraglaciecola sp.]|nr:SufS family cysteine desulfurase [Paraglaciecola sp.]